MLKIQCQFVSASHTYTHVLLTQVAVKCVRVSQASEQLSFLREVEALSSVRHPHVLPFLGACMLDVQQYWLVTEFMEQVCVDMCVCVCASLCVFVLVCMLPLCAHVSVCVLALHCFTFTQL